MILKKLLQRLFSFPYFYSQMQVFFGVDKKKALVRKHYRFTNENAVILDLGGGTGLYRDLWPDNYQYICMDKDLSKLNGLLHKYPNVSVVLADAVRIPMMDQSVDVIFCSSFSHHVPEDVLDMVFAESVRVLKASGKILFLDAVLRHEDFLNRLLWKIDRGEHPHTLERLNGLMEKYFFIQVSERFSICYDYIFFVGTKKS